MRPGANSHARGRHVYHVGYRAIMRWVTTNSRKDVGARQLEFSRTTFLVGFANIADESLFS